MRRIRITPLVVLEVIVAITIIILGFQPLTYAYIGYLIGFHWYRDYKNRLSKYENKM